MCMAIMVICCDGLVMLLESRVARSFKQISQTFHNPLFLCFLCVCLLFFTRFLDGTNDDSAYLFRNVGNPVLDGIFVLYSWSMFSLRKSKMPLHTGNSSQ